MGACGGHHDMQKEQQKLGPQSLRGGPDMRPMDKLNGDAHALRLFEGLLQSEERLCGRYAVFYHSYSHAALLYEVRAAAATLLHGYGGGPGVAAPLPRLLVGDFAEIPHARELMRRVREQWGPTKSDHNAEFRRVGISVMCSLLATGPECCMQVAFFQGYSCKKVAFRAVLEEELRRGLGVAAERASGLVEQLLELAGRHGLDASILGGRASPSGHAGHILQICVRRDLVDELCYPALPYGEIDEERLPLSEWLNGGECLQWGQARILAHPEYLMDSQAVKLFSISADPSFQQNRGRFQEELVAILRGAVSGTSAAVPEQTLGNTSGGSGRSAAERLLRGELE